MHMDRFDKDKHLPLSKIGVCVCIGGIACIWLTVGLRLFVIELPLSNNGTGLLKVVCDRFPRSTMRLRDMFRVAETLVLQLMDREKLFPFEAEQLSCEVKPV